MVHAFSRWVGSSGILHRQSSPSHALPKHLFGYFQSNGDIQTLGCRGEQRNGWIEHTESKDVSRPEVYVWMFPLPKNDGGRLVPPDIVFFEHECIEERNANGVVPSRCISKRWAAIPQHLERVAHVARHSKQRVIWNSSRIGYDVVQHTDSPQKTADEVSVVGWDFCVQIEIPVSVDGHDIIAYTIVQ